MELRTTFNIPVSQQKITYNDPVVFIGSCFALSVGAQFEAGRMPVLINPSGTVYNPASVANTLETIMTGREYQKEDLYNNKGMWLSFNHYTDFSSEDADTVLTKINKRITEAGIFLSRAQFLFVTFGTARVFKWKKSGKIVSNCHKIPAGEFTHELLTVNDIVTLWNEQIDKLNFSYPELKIVFTISPVRHWKDGVHGNQVSKSVLLLAVEELLKHSSKPGYFPAFEILMDDLRDYRFYGEDMLHPSQAAVNYIWEKFTGCFFDGKTIDCWNEVHKITMAMSHRIQSESGRGTKKFAENMLSRIDSVLLKVPSINLQKEKEYFATLLKC